MAQIISTISNPAFANDICAKCQASLTIGKMLVLAAPEQGPPLMQALCLHFNFFSPSTCYNYFSAISLGSIFTQVLALGDTSGYDGQVMSAPESICNIVCSCAFS